MGYWKQLWINALADTWSIVFGGPLLIIIVSLAVSCISLLIYKKWAGVEAMQNRLRVMSSIAMATGLVGVIIFFINLFLITPKWLFEEQREQAQIFRKELDEGAIQNTLLAQALQHRKHSIDTTDPVFPNILSLLRAFRMYRVALGHETKCTIYITAPPDSVPAASIVAQFSVATSNCATVGPHGTNLTPSLEREALEGSLPGMIIVHAPEDDKTADILVNHLIPHFRAKRGYEAFPEDRIAKTYPNNRIWLQFGSGTHFSSELVENDASDKQE